MKKNKSESLTDLFRHHDPGRGSFDPEQREPIRDAVTNPQGVRHPFKTQQDHMPRDKRPRVQEAERRRAKQGQ
jgi:hypothetical protein